MPVSIRFIVAVFILITAALLSQLNVEWRLRPQPFRRSPAAMTGVMDQSFSAERCSDLHNRLLQKAIVNQPGVVVERNLIARLVDASTMFVEILNFDSSPLPLFLALGYHTATSQPIWPINPRNLSASSGSILQ